MAFIRERTEERTSYQDHPPTTVPLRRKAEGIFVPARNRQGKSAALCEYSLGKYGRPLRFYVPTHSLLNYTQWKVMSPEGTLTDIPTLDGYQTQNC